MLRDNLKIVKSNSRAIACKILKFLFIGFGGDDVFSKRQYLNEKCSQGPDIYDFSHALMVSGTNHKSHKYQGPLSPCVFLILPFGKNIIPLPQNLKILHAIALSKIDSLIEKLQKLLYDLTELTDELEASSLFEILEIEYTGKTVKYILT